MQSTQVLFNDVGMERFADTLSIYTDLMA